jgi:hypothetical protein
MLHETSDMLDAQSMTRKADGGESHKHAEARQDVSRESGSSTCLLQLVRAWFNGSWSDLCLDTTI